MLKTKEIVPLLIVYNRIDYCKRLLRLNRNYKLSSYTFWKVSFRNISNCNVQTADVHASMEIKKIQKCTEYT